MSAKKWQLALIVLLALAVRLIWLDQPFVDRWSWRQSDVAAIARNYYAHGFHFALPQIDWAGETAGYVGTEFPILPFLAALCYKSAGVHEWIGRAQSLIFFAFALPVFFLLVKRIFDEQVAVWSLIFFSFAPLSIVSSRVFMPDMPSLALGLAGIYFYLRWLETAEARRLFFASICISLALLIKVPTAIIGAPIFYLTWERFGTRSWRQGGVWIFAAFALIPSAIWYAHAHTISQRYYPHHMFGGGGFRIMSLRWYGEIAWRNFLSALTPVLSLLAIFGAFARSRAKHQRVFHWWLAAMLIFIFVVGWGNRHPWYQLPLVPIAAVFAALTMQALLIAAAKNHARVLAWSAGILLLFGCWSFASTAPLFRPTSQPLRDAGLELEKITAPSALVIAADDGDPTIFYYAERKGWHFLENEIFIGPPLDSAQAVADFDKLRRRGATHIVFTFGSQWWLEYYQEFAAHLQANATLLEETPQFTIFQLKPEPPPRHP